MRNSQMKEKDLQQVLIPRSGEYRTGSRFEPINFFLEAFMQSTSLDLLLGYFSSSAIQVLALGFAKFIADGGRMRLVINDVVRAKDKEAIQEGGLNEPESYYYNKADFQGLFEVLSKESKHFFDCLAWMIAANKIDIVVIGPKGKKGISHYKSGVFKSNTNQVKFKGSCNFTASGLLENLEELDVKRSWAGEEERASILEYEDYFNNIFNQNADFVDYKDINKLKEAVVDRFGKKDLDDLLNDAKDIINEYQEKLRNENDTSVHIQTLLKEIESFKNKPKFPYPTGPREYQTQAYHNWLANGKKGVFAMATGTGKTITSLNCLLEEYKETKFYQALILVPTNDLQKQWIKEVGKFNINQNVIVIGVDPHWKRKLSKLTTLIDFGSKQSFVLISTYNSFSRNSLQNFLKYLPKDTLLIADEAHNIASPKMKEILPDVSFEKRIGLSATPKRIYDDQGTEAMNIFFNDSPPYTYEFTMDEAIAKGILCQYEYFPHVIELTSEELAEYKEITLKLLKFFDPETKSFSNSEIANQLLMKRKRIIHKAENKLPMFKSIIKHELKKRGKLKYSFVYVPEGYGTDGGDDNRIIMKYNQALMELDDSLRVSSFTGESDDREETLYAFEKGELDVLTAMKCLDEGVDVPRTELAIFCSSTGNPRQFIQRRGRILRQHEDKMFAVIHDLVVVPRLDFDSGRSATYNMERSQVENELKRVADFSFMARNQFDAVEKIQKVCDFYELDLFEIKEKMK
jgi:superfamily II DNA or RNA helicase